MKAAVVARYGPPEVVEVHERPVPEPGRGQALVRVTATAVNSADARIRGARFPRGFAPFARLAFGITKPRRDVLGSAFAGVVESLGAVVDGVAPGDRVCGMTDLRMGAHAQYLAIDAKLLNAIPAPVDEAAAAAVLFGGTTAQYFLRDKARLRAGATVLVNGASGAVGSLAIQIANHDGAHVTAVCSTANAALAERLGAERVIDYAATPLDTLTERFDVVLDTVGTLSRSSAGHVLADDGVLLLAVADLWQNVSARGHVKVGSAPQRTADIEELLDLLATGRLDPVHDTREGLESLVDAHRLIDSGRKVGNLVVLP